VVSDEFKVVLKNTVENFCFVSYDGLTKSKKEKVSFGHCCIVANGAWRD
jgi:hypothetical protein